MIYTIALISFADSGNCIIIFLVGALLHVHVQCLLTHSLDKMTITTVHVHVSVDLEMPLKFHSC